MTGAFQPDVNLSHAGIGRAFTGEFQRVSLRAIRSAMFIDRDGTLNDSKDNDEEWVVEMAIPRTSLELTAGGKRFEAHLSRCDTMRKTQERRCGAWPGETTRTPLDLP